MRDVFKKIGEIKSQERTIHIGNPLQDNEIKKKKRNPLHMGIIMNKEYIYELNLLHVDTRQVIGQLLNRIAQSWVKYRTLSTV